MNKEATYGITDPFQLYDFEHSEDIKPYLTSVDIGYSP